MREEYDINKLNPRKNPYVKSLNNTIEYKDYIGSVEYSEADGVLYGKVQGIDSLVSYEGATEEALIEDFHNVVDQYMEILAADVAAASAQLIEKNREAYEALATESKPCL